MRNIKIYILFHFILIIQPEIFANNKLNSPIIESPQFIYDKEADSKIPRNFRTAQSLEEKYKNNGNINGLNKLKVSGSGQFSPNSLDWIKKNTIGISNNNLIIVDLREEEHGFINGSPVTLVNSPQSESEIRIFDNKSFISEETLVKNNNIAYQRFKITDHELPTAQEIDNYILFLNGIDESSWLHFHCHAGKGRTITFLVMYDMLKNAKNVSFKDIIERQGADVLLQPVKLHKGELAKRRENFFKSFYLYAQLLNNKTTEKWSIWSSKKKDVK